MMNRRKIIAMIAALAMLLTLVAGCGGADTPAPDTSSDAAPADSAPAEGEAPEMCIRDRPLPLRSPAKVRRLLFQLGRR